jgi:hypothetical protein
MAQCQFCGAETVLFDAGTPICVKCDDERQQKKARDPQRVALKPNTPSSDVLTVLFDRMSAARVEYKRLSQDADNKIKLARGTDFNADGTLAWRQAHDAQREASEALKRYQRALQDYGDYLAGPRRSN